MKEQPSWPWVRKPDPDYDQTPPLPEPAARKKGAQCGECGNKFDYGVGYGYCCPRGQRCPMGYMLHTAPENVREIIDWARVRNLQPYQRKKWPAS